MSTGELYQINLNDVTPEYRSKILFLLDALRVAPNKADQLLAVALMSHTLPDDKFRLIATKIVEAVKSCNNDVKKMLEVRNEFRRQLL